MSQEKLEQLVVETVLAFYERYAGDEGRRKLVETVLGCVGSDSVDLSRAMQATTARVQEIDVAVSKLLDALTNGTRPFVEERLEDLGNERRALEAKLGELKDLELSRTDRHALVGECRAFIHGLSETLQASSPEVRVRTLRRCVERIVVDREAEAIAVRLRPIPIGDLFKNSVESTSREF